MQTFEELLPEFENARAEILAAINSQIPSFTKKPFRAFAPALRVISKIRSYKSNTTTTEELHPAVRDALFISSDYKGSIKDFASNVENRRVNISELFWSDYYLAKYSDLPENLDCWAHFIEFGIFEGRSPHPFLDIDVLSSQMTMVDKAPVILQFFLDTTHWDAISCKWVDIDRFKSSQIQKEQKTNLLSQIMRSSNLEHFLKSDLIEIDSSGAMLQDFDNLAYLFFAADWTKSHGGDTLQIVDVNDAFSFKEQAVNEAVIFPGFGIVHDSTAYCFNNQSSDHTKSILRAGAKVAFIDFKNMDHMESQTCVVFEGIAFRDEILQLVDEYDSQSTTYIASSIFQARAISQILERAKGVGKVHCQPKRLRESTVVVVKESIALGEKSDLRAKELANEKICLLIRSEELDFRAINLINNFQSDISLIVFNGFKEHIAELVNRQTGSILATKSASDFYSGYMSSEMIIPLEAMMIN